MRIRIEVIKMTEEDKYSEGCIIGTSRDFGIVATTEVATMADALGFCRNYGEVGIFDDSLTVQALENHAGEEPSQREIEDYKAGKINLYSATYSFYLQKINRIDIKNRNLVESFPDLEKL